MRALLLAGPPGASGHAAFRIEAELIVHLALLCVAQDVVRFLHFLEAIFGGFVAGIEIGMILPRQTAVRLPDFVGIRGLKRPDLVAEGRKQLVGLKTKDPKVVLEEGAQIVADPNQPVPMKMLGHVTSSYWSENCGHSIALALVAGGQARMGQTLYVPMPDRTIAVEVTDMVFIDKEGARLNG